MTNTPSTWSVLTYHPSIMDPTSLPSPNIYPSTHLCSSIHSVPHTLLSHDNTLYYRSSTHNTTHSFPSLSFFTTSFPPSLFLPLSPFLSVLTPFHNTLHSFPIKPSTLPSTTSFLNSSQSQYHWPTLWSSHSPSTKPYLLPNLSFTTLHHIST